MKKSTRFLLAAAGSTCLALSAGGLARAREAKRTSDSEAAAAARAARPAAVLPKAKLTDLAEKMGGDDPNAISSALAQAKQAGPLAKPLTLTVGQLLERGTRPDLTLAALEALGSIGDPKASSVIARIAHHRDPALRRAALAALVRTGGPDALAALRKALSDPDSGVRGLAATGLGTLRAGVASGDLFLALDRGIGEAASAIGELCTPDQCEMFVKRGGTLPFDIYTSGIDQILMRPSSEISDETKIRFVERLRDMGTPEVHRYLFDLVSRWPKDGSPRVKQAVTSAIMQTPGGAP